MASGEVEEVSEPGVACIKESVICGIGLQAHVGHAFQDGPSTVRGDRDIKCVTNAKPGTSPSLAEGCDGRLQVGGQQRTGVHK